jgi:cytochrome c553
MTTEKYRSSVRRLMACGLGATMLMAGLALAATEDDRLLASQCLGCHAADATGKGGFERLNGESAAEIAEEMSEMRSKAVGGNIMHLQARGYSDAQIQRIARWFAVSAGTAPAGAAATTAVSSAAATGTTGKKESSNDDRPKSSQNTLTALQRAKLKLLAGHR